MKCTRLIGDDGYASVEGSIFLFVIRNDTVSRSNELSHKMIDSNQFMNGLAFATVN